MTDFPPSSDNDIAVLREMVRLAEHRREEAVDMIDKINKYSLAVVAFAGSFLSLLISANLSINIVRFSGLCLVLSIIFSLIAIQPKRVKGGVLDIADDVDAIHQQKKLLLHNYLLETAALTNSAAESLQMHANNKKKWTIVAALFLALSLITTYILYAYA